VVGCGSPRTPFSPLGGAQDTSANGGIGAAYVFRRSGTNWSQQARLVPATGDSLDLFGWSLELFADTLVVGAPGEDSAATTVNGNATDNSVSEAGAAYVFVRSGNNWTQQAYLKAANNRPGTPSEWAVGDRFGHQVGISGNTIVVGSPFEDSLGLSDNDWGTNNGAAYVFVRSGTNWTQQAMLKAADTSEARLGASVCVSGDTILAGAGDGTYVFQREGTTWRRQQTLPGVLTGGPFPPVNTAVAGGVVLVKRAVNGPVEIYNSGGPRLVLEDAAGFALPYGFSSGEVAIQDGQPQDLAYTLRNLGNATLSNVVVTITGPDMARFSIITPPAALVAAGGSTPFTVRFNIGAGPYPKSATLQIASSDAPQSPYLLHLTGYNLVSSADSDADGLNDVAEFRLSGLGFHHLVKQTSLVNALNQAGLYDAAQIQALAAGRPVLSQIAPGQFKLTFGVQKATQLTNFVTFPMTAPQTTINDQGQLEFRFTSPDNAAFFRLEAR
jgi:hypothetical protein